MEGVIEQFFANLEVDYIHVSSTTAGCYTFRIERRRDAPRRADSQGFAD
jgi:hypothetical protein